MTETVTSEDIISAQSRLRPTDFSPDAMGLSHEMASQEDKLRDVGASKERIGSLWAREYGYHLASLAIKDVTARSIIPSQPVQKPNSPLSQWAEEVHAGNIADGTRDARSRAFKD